MSGHTPGEWTIRRAYRDLKIARQDGLSIATVHKFGGGETEANARLPPHDASRNCESGKHNHCSCDLCF